MKAWFIRGGGIDSLRLADVTAPEPGPGQALVRLTAATLNFCELVIAGSLVPDLTREGDVVPLSCAAGEAAAIGAGVERVKPGDRVSPIFGQSWHEGTAPTDPERMLGGSTDGVAHKFAVFDADDLVLLPDELSDLEAATLPVAGVTAYNALFGRRPVGPGDWIATQGTGGVSVAALQLAKAAGARVAVTSSSDAKLKRARALGADILVNYRATPDWSAEVRRQAGRGMDLVLNTAGARKLDRSAAALDEGGAIAAVRMIEGGFGWERAEIDGKPVVPIMIGHRGLHERLLAFLAGHGLRPVVDRVYSLGRLPEADRAQQDGRFFGKIGIAF